VRAQSLPSADSFAQVALGSFQQLRDAAHVGQHVDVVVLLDGAALAGRVGALVAYDRAVVISGTHKQLNRPLVSLPTLSVCPVA